MKRPCRRKLILLLFTMAFVTVGGLFLWHRSTFDSRNRIVISKETTYLDGPLTKDGYVDYLEAANSQLSEGVTSENNAAVFLWRAIGPDYTAVGGSPSEDELARRLGAEIASEKGHLVSLETFAKQEVRRLSPEASTSVDVPREKLEDGLLHLLRWAESLVIYRPWSADEFPRMRDWLEQNAVPLELVVEASHCERFFPPVIQRTNAGEYPNLHTVHFAEVDVIRQILRLMVARAMLRLHQQQDDVAWIDLFTCHRLARLLSQGPWSDYAFSAYASERIICHAYLIWLQHTTFTSGQIMQRLDDLELLPPMMPAAHFLKFERWLWLDSAISVSRKTLHERRDSWLRDLPDTLTGKSIDWNQVLRTLNYWMDQFSDAASESDLLEFDAKWTKVVKSLEHRLDAMNSGNATEIVAAELLAAVAYSDRLPYICLKREINLSMTKLAFALVAFKAQEGNFPETLNKLVPQYIAKLPGDPFAHTQPLRYRRRDTGFRLYSIGFNQRDEEGRSIGDEPAGDDISLEFPPKFEEPGQPNLDRDIEDVLRAQE